MTLFAVSAMLVLDTVATSAAIGVRGSASGRSSAMHAPVHGRLGEFGRWAFQALHGRLGRGGRPSWPAESSPRGAVDPITGAEVTPAVAGSSSWEVVNESPD
jgi:hypothetical protein